MTVTVIGWGNESRGDDAAGAMIARAVAAAGIVGVEVIEAFQLQIEHALDLAGSDLVLFADAAAGGPGPLSLSPVSADPARSSPFSHALSPEAVLAVYERITGRPAPPAYVLAVPGTCFDLGTLPTAGVAALTADAARLAIDLCRTPRREHWDRLAAGRAAAA